MYTTLLIIESNPINISKLEHLTQEIIKDYNFDSSKYGVILISLTEAVSNAIIHGNDSEIDKKVSIKLKTIENGIILRVSDKGIGFDFSDLPDPTLPENLDADGGRGIFVIRSLSDSCIFYDNGSTVEMTFTY